MQAVDSRKDLHVELCLRRFLRISHRSADRELQDHYPASDLANAGSAVSEALLLN